MNGWHLQKVEDFPRNIYNALSYVIMHDYGINSISAFRPKKWKRGAGAA